MRRQTYFTLVLALAIGTGRSGEVLAQPDSVLTLSRCLRLAVEHSFAAKAEIQRWQAERAAYQQATFGYWPQLSGQVTHNELQYRPYRFPQQFQLLTVEWQLGKWLHKAARSEMLRSRAQRLIAEQKRLEVARRAGDLYLALLEENGRLAILAERRHLLQEHLRVATALWRAGTISELDVLQTELTLKQVEEERTRREAERDGIAHELKRLLGWPTALPLRLRSPSTVPDSLPVSVAFAVDSLGANPLLRGYQLFARAQLAETGKIRAETTPALTFEGGYVVDHDPTADGNYWLVSAGLRIPLSGWRKAQLQKQQVAARAAAARLDEQDIRRELQIQVDRIRSQLQELARAYRLQQERVSLSSRTYQFAEANYQAGLVTNLDYLRAQEHLAEVKTALQVTRLEYVRQLLDLFAIFNRPDLMQKLDENF